MPDKLPRGTPVRCIESLHGSFTERKEYVVGGIYYDGEPSTVLCVVADDTGRDNGWGADKFVIAGGPW